MTADAVTGSLAGWIVAIVVVWVCVSVVVGAALARIIRRLRERAERLGRPA